MNTLTEFKKIILGNCALKELIHYRKDLTKQGEDKLNSEAENLNAYPGIRIDYYAHVPPNLTTELGIRITHAIKNENACLVAKYGDEPVGCILFDATGKARLREPFERELTFDNGVYLYGAFLKKGFRGRSIGKLLYTRSFKILKNNFPYAHILVDSEEMIPNKMVQELGFRPIGKIALIKFLGLKLAVRLNNPIKNSIYIIAGSLMRFSIAMIKMPKRFLIFLMGIIDEIAYKFLLKLYLIQSSAGKGGIRVAFICKNMPNRMFLKNLFPDGYTAKHIKTFLKQKLNTKFNDISKNSDLAIVEEKFDYLNKNLGACQNIKFIPVFIAQMADVPASLNDFSRKRDRSAYEDIRTAKIRNYTYEFIKNDEKLLTFFYENMYLPYISKRYNGEEIIAPYNLIRKSFKKGGLLLVKDENKYLSGSAIELKDGVLRPKFVGILNGDIGLLKKDALASLYYFYFKFASENGFKTIDLGLSLALLNDGVLRYKAKWKTKIGFDKKRSNVFAFRISKLTEPLKSFLINNPFISIEKNSLIGNIYLDSQNVLNEEEANKKYRLNGISELKIIYLNSNKNVDSDLKIHNLSPAVV